MTARYYRIVADPKWPERWFLAAPLTAAGVAVDPRDFTEAKACSQDEPLLLPLRRLGRPVSFNFADFDMPVVSREVAESVEALAAGAVQRVAVTIKTATALVEGYEILNVLALEKCLDEQASEVMWWTANDGRPNKTGHYRMVTNLHVDPTHIGKYKKMFRIEDWEIALIVHEAVKLALESVGVTGVAFQEV